MPTLRRSGATSIPPPTTVRPAIVISPASGALEAGYDAQGRRLAAPGGPHEARDPSALDLQVESVERGGRAEVSADPGADDRVLDAACRRIVPDRHEVGSFGRTTRKYMGTADIASSRRAEAAALP